MAPAPDDLIDFLVRSPWGWVLAGLWGALWGSFFNVCVHRLGLYESVVRPRSRCPGCGAFIAARDNVPILSWLLLRGRCRHCAAPISVRYPLVELAALLLALGLWWRFAATGSGDPVVLLARFLCYFAFAGTMLVVSLIDLDHLIIPDQITYPGIPLALVAGLLLHDVPALELVIGAVVGYGLVAITAELSYWLLKREGIGYGDAKLLALVGALLGWRGVVFAFFAAPFVGLAIIIPVQIVRRRRLFGVEVPYGPYLAGAAVLYLFVGRHLPWPLTLGPLE